MDGIHIISEQTYRTEPLFGFISTVLVCVIGAILLLIFTGYYAKKTPGKWAKIIIVVLGLSFIPVAIVLMLQSWNRYTDVHREMVVTVDDGVTLNEFYQTYKIISYENGQYTVELLEEGEESAKWVNFK